MTGRPILKTWIRIHFGIVLAILATGTSCGRSVQPQSETKKLPGVRTETERGPVKVAVEVTPAPARLSDELTMTLTIDSDVGVAIEKPPFGDAVGDFLVRDFHEPLPEVQGSREIVRQVYRLEPTQAGMSYIDPILVRFTDRRTGGDGKTHEVETDPLSLKVVSEITDVPSLASLKGFEPPRELPKPWPMELGIAGIVIALAIVVGLVWMRRRQRAEIVPELSPKEQAARELDALRQSGIGADDAKRYYVELTGIVRRFIERTTSVHAPDQTTEEFLREIGQGQVFSAEQRQRLKDFLESADLVKFAAHQPHEGDMDESFRRARSFVGLETREDAA